LLTFLDIDCRSRLHVDYLCATPFKENRLRIVELTIVDPDIMAATTNHSEAEPSVKRIFTSPFRPYVIAIQEYLISPHAL